ncbi:uncharacterized protein C5L36_0E05830 [Pichia kudriavzevii]|uniref:Glyoxylate reductase 1 n=3 Tax=Pichia kudriavzevii TaxID=4909 RepID=A0A1V2LIW4_PICKU|nr:uncharacterized protein C5L36_0E05830 [Pichia kudriavzevii]AWU78529.1 hypothetical protein C5L36_0E05830 [Pichia kudriavzevii]ONH72204.1 Glyoxylate reductase 1 [Pichia kudriavzevii]
MSFWDTGKPFKVLKLSPVFHSEPAWKKFEEENENVTIVETEASTPQEFVLELESGKYKDLNFISHTWKSDIVTGPFNRGLLELIKKHTQVKGIAHSAAGYDRIDAVACGELGIQLSNVSDAVAPATADTNVFLILSTTRNFQLAHDSLMKGQWKNGMNIGMSIQHATIGILGMGNIGRAIRDRLLGFGVKKILYYNRSRLPSELEKDSEYCSTIEELVSKSDVISISLPLNENTYHLINADLIGHMKNGVVIVNTGRGAVVDEASIKEGIKSGKIRSYGSDVFENEPNVDQELVNMSQVVSLPHFGGSTLETHIDMENDVVRNVESFYKTGLVKNLVPDHKGLFQHL